MAASKKITRTIAGLMAAAVTLCICAVGFSGEMAAAQSGGVTMEYASRLFGTDQVLGVNILMEEAQWTDMLQNAVEEEYYPCDVEIGGKTFYQVGIRPKGNTSLSAVVSNPDSDRYSFKLKFDKYVKGQTYFGLDELILNNNFADATNMKEALIYDLFAFVGADASLYQYAKISVNGEYWGVYLALEGVGDSFLLRNYGTQNGSLYKPENENMGPGSGSGSGGADLNYSDDSLDSYTTIWEGEVTKTTDSDHKRVVTALKNIFGSADLESSMDIDNLLRYMAVHIFAVNQDSLSGNMAHNYYLYESKGMLNLIPWDYNLSFGGMGRSEDAAQVVNSAIDDAFSGTDFFDTLMASQTYRQQYYDWLEKIVEEYIEGGGFDAFYSRARSLLDGLVASDPTAFYSYDAYQTAAQTLYQVVLLRGQSIREQLAGTIPSTERARNGSDDLVDASELSISAMGTMNLGGGGMPGDKQGQAPQNMQPPQAMDGGQVPGPMEWGSAPEGPSGMEEANFQGAPTQQTGEKPTGKGQSPGNAGPGGDIGRRGGGNFPGGETQPTANSTRTDNLLWYGISLGVLLAALVLAAAFRRRIR